MRKQSGIIHTGIFAGLIATLVVASIGWLVLNHNRDTQNAAKAAASIPVSNITDVAPANIKTKDDVKKAITVTEGTKIDTDLDSSTFNSDISSLR